VFTITNSFFEAFEYTEYNEANITVNVTLLKNNTMLELFFKGQGIVNVNCDLSNEPYNQKIKGTLELIVKFGEEFNDENEEVLILPHGEHKINVAQYIYEMIVLAVPAKRVHPGIKDGTLSSDILKKLKELEPKEEKKQNKEETDPRWDILKKLITDK
jgi:uncharacterized metal-binding protein YceD (DUF177 family)